AGKLVKQENDEPNSHPVSRWWRCRFCLRVDWGSAKDKEFRRLIRCRSLRGAGHVEPHCREYGLSLCCKGSSFHGGRCTRVSCLRLVCELDRDALQTQDTLGHYRSNPPLVLCGGWAVVRVAGISMQVKVDCSTLRQTKWHDYAIRFVFGG